MAKTIAWLITTFSPAFVSGLVPSLAMAPALGPYFCVRYWIRGTPLSGVVGFRKNGFHVTSKSKSLENTFMASSRWRFPTKHLRKNKVTLLKVFAILFFCLLRQVAVPLVLQIYPKLFAQNATILEYLQQFWGDLQQFLKI